MKIKFFWICIFLCVSCISKAQESESLLSKAEQLYNNAQYEEAALVYERIMFENESAATFYKAVKGKTHCLKQTGFFMDAARHIKNNLAQVQEDSLKAQLNVDWITCLYLADAKQEALGVVARLKFAGYYRYADTEWVDLLHIFLLNESERWQDAKVVCQAWLERNKLDTNMAALWYQQLPKLKSEKKAAWLSTFLPGAGQFYAGKFWGGVTNIILQALPLYYGIVSFKDKYYFSAWLLGGGIFGSFRMGDVRRAQDLVHMYNRKKITAFNHQLREQLMGQYKLLGK